MASLIVSNFIARSTFVKRLLWFLLVNRVNHAMHFYYSKRKKNEDTQTYHSPLPWEKSIVLNRSHKYKFSLHTHLKQVAVIFHSVLLCRFNMWLDDTRLNIHCAKAGIIAGVLRPWSHAGFVRPMNSKWGSQKTPYAMLQPGSVSERVRIFPCTLGFDGAVKGYTTVV